MKWNERSRAFQRLGLTIFVLLILGLASLPAAVKPPAPSKPTKIPKAAASAPAAEKEIPLPELPASRPAAPGAGAESKPAKDAAKSTKRVVRASTVYALDLDKGPGREWSHANTDATPKDNRKFLGHFGNGDEVMLSLAKLPAHKYVRLTFDLYLIKTWDGSSTMWGASTWAVSVVKGPVLLYTSFANCGFFTDNNEQSFPDSFPAATHPAWTGAAEHQTLGYTVSWGGPERTFGCDSVYKFRMAFPHEADSITLQFQGFKHEATKSESWGLANVKVETLDAPPNRGMSPSMMEYIWKALANTNPTARVVHRDVWMLIGAGPEAVTFLRSKLFPEETERTLDPKVEKLIKELDDDRYRIREDATAALEKMGPAILDDLNYALKKTTSAEVKHRLTALTEILSGKNPPTTPGETPLPAPLPDNDASPPVDPEALRFSRALDVLEVIGTKEALEILKKFDREPRRIEDLKKEPRLKGQ